MASGHERRTNRSNTWPHRPAMQESKKTLPRERRPHMAHSCRGVRRNACPFAEELWPLPGGGDIGSDGRRDCRPHAVGYFDDDPSGSPSRVFTSSMTSWPPSPMRTCSTHTYCSVPRRRRRWTSTCIVKAFSRRVAADPSAATRRSLPPPPLKRASTDIAAEWVQG